MPWVRSGFCCRCGQCCVGIPPWARRDDLLPSDPMLRTPPVAGYCPLYELQDGHGSCVGYGSHGYYLTGCNVWPDNPRQIADKPACTYTFEWRDD